MAEVWLAEQTSLRRNVALKFLRAEINSADDKYIKQFETRAKAAAGPQTTRSIVPGLQHEGVDAGQHFIAQELYRRSDPPGLLQKKGPLVVSLAAPHHASDRRRLSAAAERESCIGTSNPRTS